MDSYEYYTTTHEKEKFTQEPAMTARGGGRGIALLCL
jgi:hypothetical protein